MAERVNEAKYESMIAALQRFAANVSTLAEEMGACASTASSALSDEDEAVPEICRMIKSSELKYMKACKEALNIASAMQEELDEQRRERDVWTGDE